jgi:Fe2+ transport system protein FeoA
MGEKIYLNDENDYQLIIMGVDIMTMDQVKRGQLFRIVSIPDDNVRAQAIRFGIAEGEVVACDEIVPAGPIILRKNRQQIALGRGLAGSIIVE